ncbi:MAG: hypothetical protein BWX71_01208 [Deltaproteobacteria bacterium ADurb.Bin072]|nr:MAG: hypothetical protein BWX71_01208 [Deltaproteobacteria bacterium ADurb.Bin072]
MSIRAALAASSSTSSGNRQERPYLAVTYLRSSPAPAGTSRDLSTLAVSALTFCADLGGMTMTLTMSLWEASPSNPRGMTMG